MKLAIWYTVTEQQPAVRGTYLVYVMYPFSDDGNKVTTKYYNGNKWVNYKSDNTSDGIVLHWSDFNVHNWGEELGPGWYAKGTSNPQSSISEAERLAFEAAKKAIDEYNLIKALSQNYNNES
jgi:hypothetical protein